MPTVSVVIRTKNEEYLLGRTLLALEGQQFQDFEILLIDSGSTDRTLAIARQFQRVRIIEIPACDFSFGYALNIGHREARGDVIVNLSAHAIPANERLLSVYLGSLADTNTAGAFGRQLILPEHRPLRQFMLTAHGFEQCWGPKPEDRFTKFFFSNANAAIKRNVLADYPFNEKMSYTEDWEWARRVHAAGFRTRYVPAAAVYHSHSESLGQIYRRARCEAAGLSAFDAQWYRRTFAELTIAQFARTFRLAVARDMRYSLHILQRPDMVAYALLYNFFQLLGYYLGFTKGVNA